MTKLTMVKRCLLLPRNRDGRDFVVGDLHGHRSLFEQELTKLGFDSARDRVLSVGDLINRGPESLATLSLVEEPWFYAVLGNHELMLLNFLGYYTSRLHSRKSFPSGSGEWIDEAVSRNRKLVGRLAERVAALPVAIHVESAVPFNVAHADLNAMGPRQDSLFSSKTLCVHKADAITSSRNNINAALELDLQSLFFAQRPVQVSPTPMGPLPITYVGHTPLEHVTVHNSYVYVDQGTCAKTSKRMAAKPPTVIEHRKFAYWLGGVATAGLRHSAWAARTAGVADVS